MISIYIKEYAYKIQKHFNLLLKCYIFQQGIIQNVKNTVFLKKSIAFYYSMSYN